LSATNAADGALDTDGDGLSSLHEYVAGTDPNDPQSVLRIEDASRNADGSFLLQFTALSNHTYSVQACSFVTGAAWSRVADVPAFPTNRTIVLKVPAESGPAGQRFYRLTTPRIP
jgi:hypothetical protein